MRPQPFGARELFHLALLRHLSTRLSGRSYAVKGGICLRFFHRSPRLSEDMDLDVVSSMRPETLRNAVDSVLGSGAMISALAPAGVTGLAATRPKQTETTQRWKVALRVGSSSLPTKIEFSRRREKIAYATGVPDAELLRRYGMPPFAAQFYDADSAAAQKISALASPPRNALRDLFDLHHLIFTLGVDPEGPVSSMDSETISAAAEKVGGFSFKDFKEQVLPYLPGEMIDLYRDPSNFERQKDEVESTLIGMLV